MARDEAYYEAEKKIEEALKSGAMELDLSTGYDAPDEKKLMELPESIGKLTQFKSLKLSLNKLTSLPDSLGQFKQLQTLSLDNNQLTVLPEWMGQLTLLQSLNLSRNQLTTLPKSLGQLTLLQSLDLSGNQLTELQESVGQLTQLQKLDIGFNKLIALPKLIENLRQLHSLVFTANQINILPEFIGQLNQLRRLDARNNRISSLPDSIRNLRQLQVLELNLNSLDSIPNWIGSLSQLQRLTLGSNKFKIFLDEIRPLLQIKEIHFHKNRLKSIPAWIGEFTDLEEFQLYENLLEDLPPSLAQLEHLRTLDIKGNPLNPELAEAYKQGLDAVKAYLRAKADAQIILNEAKLILVGEGEVGKTCLMDALLNNEWQEHPSTHGIEIKSFSVSHPETRKEITLNGWDFGGQRVYRPTHQLFFSAPAVYLVVWKPREGPQQGFVKEWIQLIKRREPTAKILVVATHGGPQQRQPDIDRQELWDLFGKETVVDFFFVDSKPDEQGKRKGIEELKLAIARVAAELPEVGRSVPKSFADVRKALQEKKLPYLSLDEVLVICRENKMDDEIADLFIKISHRLGHITHYENDPILSDIVILRPDWLSTAMSYVLDDEETRQKHGLVNFSRLSQLWNDPTREEETRYSENLHKIFLKLMERFDLSYRVAGISKDEEKNPVSLIAQLVPDNRPENDIRHEWIDHSNIGNLQQVQICRIVDSQNGQSANAEGLFYQLIVRLHKYSLGRINYNDSVHWQRGLILEDEYKSRAFLEHIGNDVKITVRAPYPEGFLGSLTREIKYLVEGFWEGLRCDVMVPCVEPCGRNAPGTGLYTVSSLIESKREDQPKFPCPTCNKWQDIDSLLRNAPAAQPISLESLQIEFGLIKDKLNEVNSNTLRVLSQIDKSYNDLLQVLTDEAKEGPRLFSLFPLEGNKLNPKNWIRHQFRLVLWCEHSRLPLPILNNGDMKKGVYDFELDQDWFKKAAPYLKLVTSTLSLVLPVASSALKVVDDSATKSLQNQIGLGKSVIDAIAGEGAALNEFSNVIDSANIERGVGSRAENATLRELHALLKAKDPGFGGLVRVLNKRNEFLWVHERFAGEY